MTMPATLSAPASPTAASDICEVRNSPIHGQGVFALRAIAPGERIIEYTGERVSWDETCRRNEEKGGPLNHTFFFSLDDGMLIDGGAGGNESRWINHSCEPNCEAVEEDGRVFIHALHPIAPGEELKYNYGLIYEARHTPAVKRAFACFCGAPTCSGTMLAPKRRSKRKPAPEGERVASEPAVP